MDKTVLSLLDEQPISDGRLPLGGEPVERWEEYMAALEKASVEGM